MELLSLRQAAERLSCSAQTIRRRLDSGALQGTKVAGKFGPEWRIALEDEPPLLDGLPLLDDPARPLTRAELFEMIRVQTQVINRLSRRLRFLGDCLINCPIDMACIKAATKRNGKSPEQHLVDLIAF